MRLATLRSRSDVRTLHARLLKRLTLCPTAELVESFDDATPREVVSALLNAPDFTPEYTPIDDASDFWAPSTWWLDVMSSGPPSLHERMVWFWHGHLTSSIEKATGAMIIRQHRLVRSHAFGGFRELLRQLTRDPAMLRWLDGAGSNAIAPNENYSRELMELFALGHESGAYTEADVKAGARALAGYWIDEEFDDAVRFDPDAALRSSVPFLDRRVRNVDDVIDAVCDHEACARHVSARLYEHFVGGPLDADLHRELAAVFATANLEVRPLLEAMLFHPSFLDGPPVRPRSALEWYLAERQLIGGPLDFWNLENLGQIPFAPPNVAGWPGDDRWLSSGSLLTKAQIALDAAWDTPTLDAADPVTDVLRRAVLFEVSEPTRRALVEIAQATDGRREQSTLLHAAVAMSPEFSLA